VHDRNLTVLLLKRRIAAKVSFWTGIIFSIRLGKIRQVRILFSAGNDNFHQMAEGQGTPVEETPVSQLTRVRFSNLDKIMYPQEQITKKEVIAYYIRIAHVCFLFCQTGRLPCTVFLVESGRGFL